jgi:DNA polymerase-3 subunit gamma/tau
VSYQVLARKWRPQAFDEVAGQSHVTTPLRNAIRSGRVPHALLLTGPRGVGKTTLARILARCLNCEKGPTDTPCGECVPCREIAEGRSTDVQEVDAASRTGVDDVRELIEAIRYAATPGKHRIFVVDEVHMLSTAAFNALLKTLEEPPPRSLFVFATTNPEKIPFTVLSRCQRYDLRRIAGAEIVERLRLIARDEDVEISDRSLLAIAREADGSMRDAQTLLDQIIAFGGGAVDDEQVAQILDLIDRRQLLAILGAAVAGDAAAALAACGQAAASGVDAKRLGENLLQMLRDLVVLRMAPEAEGLVEGSAEEIAELRELAGRSDEARLRRMFRALLREQEDLAWAPRPFAVLEMALVRLATQPAGDDVGRLLARLDALERRLASGGPPGSGTAGDAAGGGGRSASASPRRRGRGARSEAKAGSDEASSAEPELAEPAEPEPAAPADPQVAEPAAPVAPAAPEGMAPSPAPPGSTDAPLALVFERLRAYAEREDHGLAAPLAGGRLVEHAGDRLCIAAPNKFAAQRLRERSAGLEEICARFFGHALRVEIACEGEAGAGSGAPTPQSEREAERRLRQKTLEHPALNAALEVLDAKIVEIRPTPRGSGPGGTS